MLIEVIEPNFKNESDKGVLLQLVRNGWKQVNVVKYKKGVVSGGHYHRFNEECFFVVSGCLDLTVWNTEGIEEHYSFIEGDMFCIHKNVFHTLVYREDSVLVALYDLGVEMSDGTKDILSK